MLPYNLRNWDRNLSNWLSFHCSNEETAPKKIWNTFFRIDTNFVKNESSTKSNLKKNTFSIQSWEFSPLDTSRSLHPKATTSDPENYQLFDSFCFETSLGNLGASTQTRFVFSLCCITLINILWQRSEISWTRAYSLRTVSWPGRLLFHL